MRGFWFASRKYFRQFVPVLVFAVTMLVGYSLTMGNIGAAFRMRAQVFNLLFLLAALGEFLKLARKKGIDEAELLNPAVLDGPKQVSAPRRPALRPLPSS